MFFFFFESLNLLGNWYMEIYSVEIQMICCDLMPKSVQGVGQGTTIQVLKKYLALLFVPFTK